MKHTLKVLTLISTPLIAILASCATGTSTTAPTPVAHRHGDLVHTHVTTQAGDHQHSTTKSATEKTTIKIAKKKIVVPVKPAKPTDIKPMGLKGIGHKHHTHIEPKTGEEGVPC